MIDIDKLKEAFRKLLSYTYFDKTDMWLRRSVAEFAKSLSDPETEKHIFSELLSVANGENQELLDSLLEQIALCYYPKQIKTSTGYGDDHFVTNIPIGHAVVERLLVKSKFPVELLILDTAWLLEYGYIIDSRLKDCSSGNRLDLTLLEDKVRYGNSLYKKYSYQYQKWWKDGLRAANEKLKNDQDVTIVNLDITNCYHSINFNFDELFDYCKSVCPETDIHEVALTKVVCQIYNRYWDLTKASDAQPFIGINEGKNPLSLSLLSSHVLANWYLSPLDEYIISAYPDVCYYGRYVDDCMIVIPSEPKNRTVRECLSELLPGLVEMNDEGMSFGFVESSEIEGAKRLSNFLMQEDKLYVYHFDCQLPQESLEKFEDDQRGRSSEFRFLTDDADQEFGKGLEYATLVKSLDVQDEKRKRFDILEENKYKLSVFFAKLNQRLARFGEQYEHVDEVLKVFKYFHNHLLIKHYMLWEKMFTAFVLSGKRELAEEFRNRILSEIDQVDSSEILFSKAKDEGIANLRKTLECHLQESYIMAMSLYKLDANIDTVYLDTFMTRTHFNHLPLQEFAIDYVTDGVRLPMTKLEYNEKSFNYPWMPYYVKYYDIVCALMLGNEFDPKIYEQAYNIYRSLNRYVLYPDEWKIFMQQGNADDECEFNTSYFEIPAPKSLTVSVVNMDLDDNKLGETIDNYGIVDVEKINLMQSILDKITSIFKTNIFILPELTLPLYELHEYCQYSAKNEKAFIAGMEYIVKNGKVYNYIVTCLPILLYGQNDAVPVIRLKNYYAPAEYSLIETEKGLSIPNTAKKWKILYHWLGHVFTNFYCFELTNIKDRAHFLSKIDAMYSSVLNKDTPYFNNIAESCVRDLHCYFILSNISKFGDSRVTQPTSSVTMNMMRVKGGNTEDNKAVVLSTEISIEDFRTFQKKSMAEQRDMKPKTFKIVPPGFDRSEVDQRKSRFSKKEISLFDSDFDKEMWDGFITNMYLNRMRPKYWADARLL